MSNATTETTYFENLISTVAEIIPAVATYRRFGSTRHDHSRSIWKDASRSQRRRFIAAVCRLVDRDWFPNLTPYWRFRLFMEITSHGRGKERIKSLVADLGSSPVELVRRHRLWDAANVADLWRDANRAERRQIRAKVDEVMGDSWLVRGKQSDRFALFAEFASSRDYAQRLAAAKCIHATRNVAFRPSPAASMVG